MRTTFHAMGCTVEVTGGTSSSHRSIERLFVGREATFSRFLDDSELTRVNGSRSDAVFVSEEFARAVGVALDAERATDGVVTPLVHDALVSAGYDRSLHSLRPIERRAAGRVPSVRRHVQVTGRLVGRRRGARLDLAGVVKGMTVDAATALLDGPGFVSAGGDIAVTTPTIIELPGGGSIALHAGGVATSGTTTRRWLDADGRVNHHLVDPTTGAPARVRWSCATVIAGSCLGADVAAKAAFVLGDRGPGWLDGLGLPGRFLTTDGSVVVNRIWRDRLRAAEGAA